MLLAAHGNSLRALVKHLDEVSDADIVELNIPTGIPLVYELDEEFETDPPLLSRGCPARAKGDAGRGEPGIAESPAGGAPVEQS